MSRAGRSHGSNSSSGLTYQFFPFQLVAWVIQCRLSERMYPSLENMFLLLEICYRLSLLVTWTLTSALCLIQSTCLGICCLPSGDLDPGGQVTFPSLSGLDITSPPLYGPWRIPGHSRDR